MPQLKSYPLIQLDNLGIVKNQLEENRACKVSSSNFIHLDTQNYLNPKKRISRELFFACRNCDGPLVQHSFCKICKKTDMRVCVKCNKVECVGEHRNCLRIIMLDMKKILPKEGERL